MTDGSGVVVAAHSVRAIEPDSVLALYRQQDWWPERTAGQVAAALSTAPAAGAWQADDLVGFARAVTDGVLRAYVEDVIVAPDLRQAGIGSALVDCLTRQLAPVPLISLFCPAGLVPFYSASNFRPTSQVVMHRRA